jgi:hypothetical protein
MTICAIVRTSELGQFSVIHIGIPRQPGGPRRTRLLASKHRTARNPVQAGYGTLPTYRARHGNVRARGLVRGRARGRLGGRDHSPAGLTNPRGRPTRTTQPVVRREAGRRGPDRVVKSHRNRRMRLLRARRSARRGALRHTDVHHRGQRGRAGPGVRHGAELPHRRSARAAYVDRLETSPVTGNHLNVQGQAEAAEIAWLAVAGLLQL